MKKVEEKLKSMKKFEVKMDVIEDKEFVLYIEGLEK
jgi:hypothetical protein